MEHEKTVLEKVNDPRLPGAMIIFSQATSTGYHENSFGVGSMDVSFWRRDQKFQWIDLGHINYSNPTASQYLDAETSPDMSEGWKASADHHRRVSKLQAEYIVSLIQEMLMKEFKGVIPPDDEIKVLFKQRFPDKRL